MPLLASCGAGSPDPAPTPNLLAPPAAHAKMTARRQGNHQKRHTGQVTDRACAAHLLALAWAVAFVPSICRAAIARLIGRKSPRNATQSCIVHSLRPHDAIPAPSDVTVRAYPFFRPRVLIPSHFSGAEQPWHIFHTPRPPGRRSSLPPPRSSSRPPTPARADIFRWDNHQIIPGTEGIAVEPGMRLDGFHLGFASLRSRGLTGASFDSSVLANARMAKAELVNVDFSDADLTNADFDEQSLPAANFADAVINGASFRSTTIRHIPALARNSLQHMEL